MYKWKYMYKKTNVYFCILIIHWLTFYSMMMNVVSHTSTLSIRLSIITQSLKKWSKTTSKDLFCIIHGELHETILNCFKLVAFANWGIWRFSWIWRQVEFVWTPDLSRVKLIYLRLDKTIQKSTSENNRTEKKFKYRSFKAESITFSSGAQISSKSRIL